MNTGITAINEEVQRASAFVRPLMTEMSNVVVGQTYLVERLIIGLLANGHVLLEGVPGLAKTLSVKTLAPLALISWTVGPSALLRHPDCNSAAAAMLPSHRPAVSLPCNHLSRSPACERPSSFFWKRIR